ncbi:MAG: PCRF domain-containing protein, partial [Clostridia bacterium]|nr:PCRF domain-containing protein [Clostridia bacterium]
MLNRLKEVEQRYFDIEKELEAPDVMSDRKKYLDLTREYKSLGPVIAEYREYSRLCAEIKGAEEIIELENDEELRDIAKEEAAELRALLAESEDKLKILLLPKDPNDSKNVIIEI